MLSKVDNVGDLLFAFLEVEVFSQKGNICSSGKMFFLYEMTPIIWESTMKMTVASPESVPIRLKIQ